jgi:hypothetical protein
MILKKIISGGQIGADQAGLRAAKVFGFETGGYAPKGYRTLSGPNPELGLNYGLIALESPEYPVRTQANVEAADGTLRLAFDFGTPGEKATFRAIKELGKPWFDVHLSLDPPRPVPSTVASWILGMNIQTLNIAGNADERTYVAAFGYLCRVFMEYGLKPIKPKLTAKVNRKRKGCFHAFNSQGICIRCNARLDWEK